MLRYDGAEFFKLKYIEKDGINFTDVEVNMNEKILLDCFSFVHSDYAKKK